MAGNSDFNIDYGLDVSQATAELRKLENQLNNIVATFRQSQSVVEASVKKMATNSRRFTQTLGGQARGGRDTQIADAAASAIVADAAATGPQVQAKISDALVRSYSKIIRNTNQVVSARINTELAKVDEMVARSTQGVLSARRARLDRSLKDMVDEEGNVQLQNARRVNRTRRQQDEINRAQYGDGYVNQQKTLERLNADGGAGLVGIQSRVMMNFMGLAAMWQGASGLGMSVVELDDKFKNFQAIAGTTGSEMVGLKEKLIGVSQATKFTANEIVDASVLMAQAGMTAAQVGETVESVAKLATASGSDLASAVDIVTSTMTAFNLTMDQAPEIANTFTAALNESKLTLQQLTLGIQYAGNTASSLGITYQELVANLGALANAGIRSGSTQGTGLRALLIDLTTPSKKLVDMLHKLGLTEEHVNVQTQGLAGVMKNLHDAGFGSAEAFETLEVRAAAAYTALNNNVTAATKLQESFVYSQSAIEANDVQMTSLVNTSKQLYSNLTVSAYRAFMPFINVLQQVAAAASAGLGILNEYPKVLGAIGVALSALLTAGVFTLFTTVARGVLGMGAGFATTTGILGTFGATIASFIPHVRILLAVITALSVAWNLFGSTTNSIAQQIDETKGRINEIEGQADASIRQVEAINQTVESLQKQKDTLDKNPIERQAKVLQVVHSFKELANQVDVSTASIDQLIAALNRLKGEDYTRAATSFVSELAEHELLLEKYQEEQKLIRENMNMQNMQRKVGSAGRLHIWAAEGLGVSEMASLAGKSLNNPAFTAIVETLYGKRDFKDSNELLGQNATIDRTLADLKTQQGTLSRKGKLTDQEAKILAQLPAMIGLVQELKAQLAPLLANASNIDATKANIEANKFKLMDASIRGSKAFQELTQSSTDLETQIYARTSQLKKTGLNKTPNERVAAFDELGKTFNAEIDGIATKSKTIADQIKKDFPELDPAEVDKIVGDYVKETSTGLRNLLKNSVASDNKIIAKEHEKALKERDKVIDAEIRNLTKIANQAISKEQVDQIREYIDAQYDAKLRVLAELYKPKDGEKLSDDQEAEYQDKVRELNLERQQARRDLVDDEVRIQKNLLKAQKQAAEDHASVLNKQIQAVIEEIKTARPGEQMAQLVQKFNELMKALAEQNGIAGALSLQEATISSGNVQLTGAASNRASQAMAELIRQGFHQSGAAAIVGNLLVESVMSGKAQGDYRDGRPTAFGLAQWRFDRWDGVKNAANKAGVDPTDSAFQLQYLIHDLKSKFPQLYAELQAGGDPATLTKRFMDVYERPKNDPKVNHIARRQDYATGLTSGDYAKENQEIEDAVRAKTKAVTEAEVRAVKQAATATSRSSTQSIETLMQQSKLTDDPEVIEGIATSVKDQYKKVIEAKVKAFDAENAKALSDGDEEIKGQRDDLIKGLNADLNGKISTLLSRYTDALDTKYEASIKDAQAKASAARLPENVNKFSEAQLAELDSNVRLQERLALEEKIKAVEMARLQIQKEAAMAGSEDQKLFWKLQEEDVNKRLLELTRQKNAEDQASSQNQFSIADGVRSANEQWAIQAGLMERVAGEGLRMVPVGKQIETAWGQVLNGLTSSFSTLFSDLAKGTKSAEEAFRDFGLSVLDMFIQMIAKALAYQVIMSFMGGPGQSGGGGIMSQLLSGMLGIPGMATGGPSASPYRDGVITKVMPGEFILRQSAASALGKNELNTLNNLGNRAQASGISPVNDNDPAAGAGTVNVWVVSQDQVPPPGPNDIIATVADNIQRRGSLKELIRQVNLGAI